MKCRCGNAATHVGENEALYCSECAARPTSPRTRKLRKWELELMEWVRLPFLYAWKFPAFRYRPQRDTIRDLADGQDLIRTVTQK